MKHKSITNLYIVYFIIFQIASFICDSIVEIYKVMYANTSGKI